MVSKTDVRRTVVCAAGWVCSASFMLAPQACSEPKHAETASTQVVGTTPSALAGDATPQTTPAHKAAPSWQADLLAQSMQVASSLQTKAHARVKARLQKDVAATAIDVGMIDVGIRYADAIEDWRRGEALALAAQALARKGDRASAESCVAKAVQVAASTEPSKQERLNIEIALAMALLGNADQARQFGARAAQDLTGQVEAQLASQVPIDELDRQCDAFDRAISTGSFDIVHSGVDGYFSVWSRVRSDPARGARAEKAIRGAFAALPPSMQIDTHLRLADALDAIGQHDACMQELQTATTQLREGDFLPDTLGPLARDVALARARHGDAPQARELLADMLARYERAPTAMVDIERADYLRPLAEALQDLGDREQALRIWTLALEAGSVNPNARPRAEDLCLTSLSMVRCGAKPTEGMRTRMADIQNGLKAPW